jgi:hypothetical protein
MSGTTRLAAWLGTWGRPIDRPAMWALGLALLLGVLAVLPASAHHWLGIPLAVPTRADVRRRVVVGLSFVAAFLSLGYVAYYLRGGPRIIDATSYFLEGRALSHGHIHWSIPSPTASFRGRFLLFQDPDRLAVIFPPGFPLLLAAAFIAGGPLVVGPILAGLLVATTYALALELAASRGDAERHSIATLAAALSIVCVTLRYHTADTMAHGASALGFTVALAAALRGDRTQERGPWLAAGLATGWVVCTRPFSSLAVLAVVLALAVRRRRWGAVLVGMLPGVLFLLLASHAQTGHWLSSAQAAYYATSDGPPGCFHYGFGSGVGCLYEHKDFVTARLPHGYGVVAATLTTLRRLRAHLLDVANLEPLALLILVPLRRSRATQRETPRARLALAAVFGQFLAYAPFYFDGSYPGGGARFFADVLPVEHALLALGVASVMHTVPLFRRALAVVSLAAFGFAVHGVYEHEALANRDAGHPMFDPEAIRGTDKGVLFFDTDHGFDLAYDPFVDPAKGLLAARLRGDDHDRLLIERLGHPPAHIYRDDPKHPTVVNWTSKPGGTRDLWRFEAEAEWPPILQAGGGWAEPVWASTSCASDGRVLTLHGAGAGAGRGKASARIEVPVPRRGKWVVTPRVLFRGGAGRGSLRLIPRGRAPAPGDEKLVWQWSDSDSRATPAHDACLDLPPPPGVAGVDLDVAGAEWELTAEGGEVSLDQTILRATR